ncbi:MAG: hypothetical protein AAGH76_12360 [Pseudomonadota bacterium]
MKRSDRQLTGALNLVAVLAVLGTLAACSDSSSPSVTDASLTGRIVGPTIAGISYATPTESGVLSSDGEFRYAAGETITFSLGATKLATVTAADRLTWFNLAGLTSAPTGNGPVARYSNALGDAPSLDRVGAIAALLTTVDEDQNLANGIVITPAVAALFDDVTVSLDYASDPTFDPSLKRLLRQAHRDGVLNARRPRNGGYALADVYAANGIDAGLFVAERYETDNGNNGQLDGVRRLTYNTTGEIVGDWLDQDGDGTPEILVDLSYDSEGYGSVYATDRDADGTVDSTRSWQVDEFGDVIRYAEDTDGDGDDDFIELRTLNADYLRVRREVINETRGTHTIEVWNTDADGNRTSYDLDLEADGTYDTLVTMTYDKPLGPWRTRTQDDGRDGTVDQYRERDYDAADRIVRDANDTNGDGNFDTLETWVYDANGLLITKSLDTDGDGAFDRIDNYTRNPQGWVLRSETDTDGDGNPNSVREFTYDATGLQLVRDQDVDGDGTFDRYDTLTYNANRQLTEVARDTNGDGQVDWRQTTVFDADGRAVRSETDSNNDGTIETLRRFSEFVAVSIAQQF